VPWSPFWWPWDFFLLSRATWLILMKQCFIP